VWAAMAVFGGAWRPLPVADAPPLTARAYVVTALVLVVFGLTFMPVPMETETTPPAPPSSAAAG